MARPLLLGGGDQALPGARVGEAVALVEGHRVLRQRGERCDAGAGLAGEGDRVGGGEPGGRNRRWDEQILNMVMSLLG